MAVKNKYFSYLIGFSIVIAILNICLAVYSTTIKNPFWLISLTYCVLLIMTSKNNQLYFAPGIFVLNIVMFMRYSILIMAIYISGELSPYANNYNYLNEAVFLIIYEQLFVFMTLYFTGRIEKHKISFLDIKEEMRVEQQGSKALVCVALACILVGILITHQYLVGGLSLITKGVISSSDIDNNSSGVVSIIWQACLAWLYIFFCTQIKQKINNKKGVMLAVFISAVYILLTFIGQPSISRWYTIISFVAVYFILSKLYPKGKKIVVMCIVIPAIVLLTVVSVYKNTNYLSENISFSKSILLLFDSKKLEAYFSGPVNVNNAIGLYVEQWGGISSLPLDVVNNMPVVNHWFDTSAATVNLYNRYIGRFWNGSGDQIIPLIGQSSIYFSTLFAPLLSCIAVTIVRVSDRRYIQAESLDVYIFAFLGAWSAVALILNMTIFLSWMYIRIIPLLLLTVMIEIISTGKIRIKRRKKL